MKPRRVYIASPYTIGDVAINVRKSLTVADCLVILGHHPYCPLLNHFWHMIYPRGPVEWLLLDLAWLAQCEAVIRLPGESAGADQEVAEAHRLGIPVYNSVAEFLEANNV